MKIKYCLFTIICMAGVTVASANNPSNLLVINEDSSKPVSNEVLVINYDPVGFQAKDTAKLKIAMDPNQDKLCLYTDDACTQNPRCTNFNKILISKNHALDKDHFSAGFTVQGLNELAKKNGHSPAEYRCMRVELAYSLVDSFASLLPASQSGTYQCKLAAKVSGDSFIGNDSMKGETCADAQSHVLIKDHSF